MEYQEKLVIFPAVQDMNEPMTITVHEAVGTGICYNAVGGNEEDGFVITHLASKKYLCKPISTEHEVRLLMKKVVGITDWNQDEKALMKPEIAEEFRKCQQTVKQEINMQLEIAMRTCMPDYLVEDVLNEFQDDEYPVLRNALLYAFKIIPSNVGA